MSAIFLWRICERYEPCTFTWKGLWNKSLKEIEDVTPATESIAAPASNYQKSKSWTLRSLQTFYADWLGQYQELRFMYQIQRLRRTWNSPDYCRSVPEENASLIVFLFQRNFLNRVLIRFFPYTAQTRHFASLFYQGLQFLHGSYPSAITSSRVPVNSCRFAAFIWVTDVQLGRWNFFELVLRM